MRMVAGVAVVAALIAAGLPGCSDRPKEQAMKVFCAAGIKSPAEALARQFTAAPVRFEFGGTGRLLARMRAGADIDLPDVFIVADETHAEAAAEAGLIDRQETIGYLTPVIVVSKKYTGAKIETLADLARPGLRVVLGETRGPAIGRISEKMLADAGVGQVSEQAQRRDTVQEVAMPVSLGVADAAIIWHDTARQGDFQATLDVVQLANPPVVRMVICRVAKAPNKQLADRFIDLAISDVGRSVFRDAGYEVDAPYSRR